MRSLRNSFASIRIAFGGFERKLPRASAFFAENTRGPQNDHNALAENDSGGQLYDDLIPGAVVDDKLPKSSYPPREKSLCNKGRVPFASSYFMRPHNTPSRMALKIPWLGYFQGMSKATASASPAKQ
jgi:hypothetical protein